jgi:hypothetical protein
MAACYARVYVPRSTSDGVAPVSAALISERDAYATCALAGWSLAVERAAGLTVATSTASCPPCAPCLTADVVTCEARPEWVDALSHGAACAVCVGVSVAISRVAP